MDTDQLKSGTEDQMEMMMMMMDKLPEFYGAYNDVADLAPPPEFPGATTNTNSAGSNAILNFIDNPHIGSSPPFMASQSNLPFTSNNTPIQEDSPPPAFLSNPPTARWRSVGEFPGPNAYSTPSQKKNSMAAMREMIFRIAAMQPIHIDPESVKPPKRRNVKISKDPQSVAARHRRERISERIRILQRLVPGGTKMDTASMLDEAIHYVKFLKTQVQSLERAQANRSSSAGIGFPVAMSSGSYLPMGKALEYQQEPPHQNVQHYEDA
ncbi:hypothetical protein P3X46_002290 [Hevea brasiliensis]|uniref:BHLH domain-containing protein n=1 Tax=Hevea brasiliensis TaxID=3981 RepID=A0ABQ9N2I3_HEVBR|nr:transcription factor HEC1-like [Hevea brasiliensis]KAJ9186752.1 hypothetical protein P3X46_002290 [Hevea brasiliensis]